MALQNIQVDNSGHFLKTADGEPFFWLGDTAWNLLHQLDMEQTEHFLEVRRQQGFNVINTVILAEFDGLHVPNAGGHIPLCGDDPTRPNEYYFRHVDKVVNAANDKEMYVGLLPTWGDKVHKDLWGTGPIIFNTENARIYGEYLGQRYCRSNNIIWILGGDRPADGYEQLWAAMAKGISSAYDTKPLMSYHPAAPQSTSDWLHNTDWLDVNMHQSGHALRDASGRGITNNDYNLKPPKPVLDGEPCYEHIPVTLHKYNPEYGRFNDYDIRKQAYRSVFAGACGHVYGHHSIWQFYDKEHPSRFNATEPWTEAVYATGAKQLVHLKNLMLSRPYFSRIPAQELLYDTKPLEKIPFSQMPTICPQRAAYPAATRCKNFSYAMIYFPLAEQTLNIDLREFPTKTLTASWFDPRSGKIHDAGKVNTEKISMTSPIAGPDWVLVLDATS